MRLLIVSNRAPVTVVTQGDGHEFLPSVGGLATGLRSFLDSFHGEFLWVGWPGVSVEGDKREKIRGELRERYRTEPVFVPEPAMESFYHGFCNKTIWPLFHYFAYLTEYAEQHWNEYVAVNERFRDAVLEVLRPDDVVWVHDYHLMLLPRMLRERVSELPIGFFLHIPFPSYEIFRLLPRRWREGILQGLLGADLVGFHTVDYTQPFLRSVLRILGCEHQMGLIPVGQRMVRADTFPMGIDFRRFAGAASVAAVQQEISGLRGAWKAQKVVLSVDRLDYSKGILQRLEGYELFLQANPGWHRKVVLSLVLVPSRIGVDKYQQIKQQIDERVGKINGTYGSPDWSPILYQYRALPFEHLAALYAVGDVALITPLRDGMNLIAKEYLAARTDGTGVLILSELAGAARELGEAIQVNPNNRQEIADALRAALEMPVEEQIRRNGPMRARLERNDVNRWADQFLEVLAEHRKRQKMLNARVLSPSQRERIVREFAAAKRRLVLLDYDGTLVPFAAVPHQARPGRDVLAPLERLGNQTGTEAVLISGRDKSTVERWFGAVPVHLVAEHGIWIRPRGDAWSLLKPLTAEWTGKLLPLLERAVDRVPDSMVEEKGFSIAWHYRGADPELGELRAKELVDDLVDFTANYDVQVLHGNKVVEVRPSGVNKGTAALVWLGKGPWDFILAAGDDTTDEDLFRVLPAGAHSLRVGIAASRARFNVPSPADLVRLLADLVSA